MMYYQCALCQSPLLSVHGFCHCRKACPFKCENGHSNMICYVHDKAHLIKNRDDEYDDRDQCVCNPLEEEGEENPEKPKPQGELEEPRVDVIPHDLDLKFKGEVYKSIHTEYGSLHSEKEPKMKASVYYNKNKDF